MTNNNPWIPWLGGGNPALGKLVDYKLVDYRISRCGDVSIKTSMSDDLDWSATSDEWGIRFYRLAEAAQEPDWQAVRIQAVIAHHVVLMMAGYHDAELLAMRRADVLIAALKDDEK